VSRQSAAFTDQVSAHLLANLTYDPNGNVQTMLRNGPTGNSMDRFTYRYAPNSNKLLSVKDDAGATPWTTQDLEDQDPADTFDPLVSSTWNYQYDAVGNAVENEGYVPRVNSLVTSTIHRPQGGCGLECPVSKSGPHLYTMRDHICYALSAFLLLGTGCSVAQTDAPITAAQTHSSADLEAPAFKAMLEQHAGLLVDVRTPAEFASGHIDGAINLDWTANDYETKFSALDPKQPVLVYCAMGGRSDQAKEFLVERGYTVIQLMDGINGWKKAGLPVVE